jgi:ABC-type multidrug transport system ATPase subunit
MMNTILSSNQLGKRYGSLWALKNCSFTLEEGHVTGLVGPNGAGKSTLLELAVGLLAPSEGTIQLFGASPTKEPMKVLPRVGFVAQEHPLYRDFTVTELLKFGGKTNPRWDDVWARGRIEEIGLPPGQKSGQLSGGQQAQLALVLALAKKPDLLLLDEPVAGFDPLARREFLQLLMETVAESGVSVLLSSHIIGDIESVCDSLLLLGKGEVQLSDDIEHILASHRLVIGPVEEEALASSLHTVIDRSSTEKQVAMLVRLDASLVLTDRWTVHEPTLEDIVLGYLQRRDRFKMSTAARRSS